MKWQKGSDENGQEVYELIGLPFAVRIINQGEGRWYYDAPYMVYDCHATINATSVEIAQGKAVVRAASSLHHLARKLMEELL